MRHPLLLFCVSLGLSLGFSLAYAPDSIAKGAGPAKAPVLYVPPADKQPSSEPPPAGEKLVAEATPAPVEPAAPPAPKPAAKARRLRVTIAPLPSPTVTETAVVAVQRELGESLRRNTHLDMKDLDLRLADFAQEMPTDQVDFARESFQKGKDALYKLEVDKAIAQLSDAVDQLVAVLPYIKKQELAEAMMSLAVAQQQKGKNGPMAQTLRRLLTWRPGYQPDASVPPQMNDSLEAARQVVASAPQGQVKIVSDPPGAQVFVDGDYLGVAPTVAPNLAAGEHYLTFKKLGYKRGLRVAQVTAAGASVQAKLQRNEKYLLVEQALARVAPQMGKSPLDPVVDNLRETLFLDHIVFVQVERQEQAAGEEVTLHGYLYDLRSRKLLRTESTRVRLPGGAPAAGSLSSLADSLYASIDYEGSLQVPVDKPPPPVAESKPLYKRWWFWTALGVIVAGGASALAVGLATRTPSCPDGHVCTGSITYALTF